MSLKDKQKLRRMKSDVFKRIATIDFIEIYIPTEFVVAVDKKKHLLNVNLPEEKITLLLKRDITYIIFLRKHTLIKLILKNRFVKSFTCF